MKSNPVSWSTADLLKRLGHDLLEVPSRTSNPAPSGALWGLTGATGWWGRHAARALLTADSESSLVVPVRADNPHQAHARLAKAWALPGSLPKTVYPLLDRTQIICIEDLSSASLNKTEGLHGVIHAAANLSHAQSLESAWSNNVTSTLKVWDWACRSDAKRFDHISTLSVWVAADTPSGILLESDSLLRASRLYGPYAATKWAAEVALSHEAARSSPALAIHRLGLVSHSETDGWAPSSPLAATASAWARWGRPPWITPLSHEAFDWSPTLATVNGVLSVAFQGGGGPFHWAGSSSISAVEWINLLREKWGDAPGDWPRNDALGKEARRAFDRWSHPLHHQSYWWHDLFQSSHHHYDAQRASLFYPRWDSTIQAVHVALNGVAPA